MVHDFIESLNSIDKETFIYIGGMQQAFVEPNKSCLSRMTIYYASESVHTKLEFL